MHGASGILYRMADAENVTHSTAYSRVIVMASYEDRRRSDAISSWHAVWQGDADPTQPLGEFDGTRGDALAWARACCPSEILVYDPEIGDLRTFE
jgi:hypothetical protein